MFIKSSFWLLLFIWLFSIPSKVVQKDVYASLVIPKINLDEKIYEKDSIHNNLNYGLFLLPESSYIEEDENAQIIIASHSGTAKVSYFKNLDELDIQDEIKIILDDDIYFFRVIEKYYEKKDGKINIKKPNGLSLALVTCTKNTLDLQTVIVAINVGKMAKI